ncbi:MAG: tetratricopeptide repeat protein [Cyclobacteriaceae bacterium]
MPQEVTGSGDGIYILLAQGDELLDENPVSALDYYQKAISLSEGQNDSVAQAVSRSKLGHGYYLIGDYYTALVNHRKALTISIELESDSLIAEQLSHVGSIYYFGNIGDLEKALDYFEEAYKIFMRLGHDESAGLNLNNMGYVYWAQGDKERALATHEKALEFFEGIGDEKGIATSLSDIGFTLNSMGKYQEALHYHFKALEMERRIKRVLMEVPTLNNIGKSYQHLGDYQKSLNFSIQSLEMAQKRGLLLRQNEAAATLHKTYQMMGDLQKAYDMLMLHKKLNDSLTSSDQARKILALELEQEFNKKAQIAKLEAEKDKEISIEKLQQVKRTRLGRLIISVLFVILLFVTGIGVIVNRQVNKQLSLKKEELDQKNRGLEEALVELKETHAELTQMEKMASLGLLSTGLAHEINNPLNFIMGGMSMIESAIRKPGEMDHEQVREVIAQINGAVARASQIIQNLNRFSRKYDFLEFIPTKLPEVVEGCLLMLNKSIADKCEVKTYFEPGSETIISNESVLFQVLLNLITNSADAMKDKGIIQIHSSIEANTGDVLITVADNGVGIDPKILTKIYDPFFTTKDVGEGTGLGLSITYRLIKNLGGQIRHESTPGKGTTAFITLKQ